MPKTWPEIEALPDFQSLPEDQRSLVQQKWFSDAVAPKLPTDEVDKAREFFFAKFPHGNQDPAYGQSTVAGVGAGLEQGLQKGLTATVATGPGAILSAVGFPGNVLLKTGREIEAGIEADSPISRENKGKFIVEAGEALGQAGSMLVTGGILNATTLPRIALLAASGEAAGMEAEANRLNITDPASRAALIFGGSAIGAGFEMAGGGIAEKGAIRAIRGVFGKKAVEKLPGLPMAVVSEGLEEGGTGMGQRALGQAVATEDPNNLGMTYEGEVIGRWDDMKQALRETALGSVAGGGIHAVQSAFNRLNPQQQLDVKNVADAGLPEAKALDALTRLTKHHQDTASAMGMASDAGMGVAELGPMQVMLDGRGANIIKTAQAETAAEYTDGFKDRENQDIHVTGADYDIFFQGGKWEAAQQDEQGNLIHDLNGQPVFVPAPETPELEKLKKDHAEWIKTGKMEEMPEGMQPLAAPAPQLPVATTSSQIGSTAPASAPASAPATNEPPTSAEAPAKPAAPEPVISTTPEASVGNVPLEQSAEAARVASAYPNSPELAERVAAAESPAAVQVLLTENEPKAQLVEELSALPPIELADRMREAGADEVTVAELTEGNLDFKGAAEVISGARAGAVVEEAAAPAQEETAVVEPLLTESEWADQHGAKYATPKYTPGKMGVVNVDRSQAIARGKNQKISDANAAAYADYVAQWEKSGGSLANLSGEDSFGGNRLETMVRWVQRTRGDAEAERLLGESGLYEKTETGRWAKKSTTSAAARTQPDEFESRLRQTIISDNLRGWTDADVQAAVKYHETQAVADAPAQVKLSVIDRVERAMSTPKQRQERESAERAQSLKVVQDQKDDLRRARETTDPIKNTDPDLVKWADGVIEEGELNFGLNPRLMAAHAVRSADWITRNGLDFLKWSGEQISRFGQGIRDYLRRIWDAARALLIADNALPEVLTGEVEPVTVSSDADDYTEIERADSPRVLPSAAERRRDAVQRLLDRTAEAQGAKVELHRNDDQPDLAVRSNAAGELTVAVHEDYADILTRLTPTRKAEMVAKYRATIARQAAYRTLGADPTLDVPVAFGSTLTGQQQIARAIYDTLRQGYNESAEVKGLWTAALEVARERPYQNERQRAYDLGQLTWELGRDPQKAIEWVDHLLRLASERQTGKLAEDRGGVFLGNKLWRDRVHRALDRFNARAREGGYGKTLQRLLDAAETNLGQSAVEAARAVVEDALLERQIAREAQQEVHALGSFDVMQRARANPYREGVRMAAEEIRKQRAEGGDRSIRFVRNALGARHLPEIVNGAAFAVESTGRIVIATDQVYVTLADRRQAQKNDTSAAMQALRRVMAEAENAANDVRQDNRMKLARAMVGDVIADMQATAEWPVFVNDLWDHYRFQLEQMVRTSTTEQRAVNAGAMGLSFFYNDEAQAVRVRDRNQAAVAWLTENFGPQIAQVIAGEQGIALNMTPGFDAPTTGFFAPDIDAEGRLALFTKNTERFVKTSLAPYLRNTAIRFSKSAEEGALPRNENIKIGPVAARAFKERIQVVADDVEHIRAGYDGVGRLMETSLSSGGENEAVAFREWLLKQKGLSSDARQALLDYRTPKSETRLSVQRPKVIATGVKAKDVDAAKEGLAKLLPNVATAWSGTRAELNDYLRKNDKFKRSWMNGWMSDPANAGKDAEEAYENFITDGLNGVEAFARDQRTFLINDQIAVLESDGSAANAARRVLVHEDAHEGLEHLRDIDPAVNAKWEEYRDEIPAAELDELVPMYPWMSEWRSDKQAHDDLAHEWIAKKIADIEWRGQPAVDTLIGRILSWFRGIVRRLTGNDLAPSDQALLDFMDAAREARFRSMSEPGGGYANADGDVPVRRALRMSSNWTGAPLDSFTRPGQILGRAMELPGSVQENKPIRDYARQQMGALYDDPVELSAENTANAYRLAHDMLGGGDFFSRYKEGFRAWDRIQRPDAPPHGGDAAVGMLQLELLDYASRLAAETGDSKLLASLLPVANSMLVGDENNATIAGRTLQIRSAAVYKDNLYSFLKATLDAATRAAAGTKQGILRTLGDAIAKFDEGTGKVTELGELGASVDPSLNKDLQEPIVEGITDSLTPAEGAALEKNVEDYEVEGWRERAREAMAEHMAAKDRELETVLRKLDQLLQIKKMLDAKGGSQIKPSMQEDYAAYSQDPEALQREIDALMKKAQELLSELTAQDTSHETKAKRKSRTGDARVQRARKALSADEQGKKLIERYENRNQSVKRVKPAWLNLYEKQIKEPVAEDEFLASVMGEGVAEETANRLLEIATEIRADMRSRRTGRDLERYYASIEKAEGKEAALRQRMADQKAKAEAKASNKAISKAEQEAEEQERAEKERAEKRKADLEKYYRDIEREEAKEAALQAKVAEQRTKDQTKAANKAETERLRQEQKEVAEAIRKAKEQAAELERLTTPPKAGKPQGPRASYKRILTSIARQVAATPLSQQGDPAWVKQAFVKAFEGMGFPTDVATRYAEKLAHKHDQLLRAGQEKAALKAAKALDVKEPTLKVIQKAIRSGAFDPLNPNPVIRGLAEKAGYKPLSRADFQALAKLDQEINTSLPTLAAEAQTKMARILAKVRPGKSWQDVGAQLFTNGALSSLGVFGLNWLHAAYVLPRKMVTDLSAILGDTALGNGSRTQNIKMMRHVFTNLFKAHENWINEARFSLVNDAYSNRMLEALSAAHSLYTELMTAMDEVENWKNNPGKATWAAVKVVWLSEDWVRRILSSADQTWGSVIQEFVLRNEAMRMMVQDAGMTVEAAALIIRRAAEEGALKRADAVGAGMEPYKAALHGRDVMRQSLAQGLDHHMTWDRSDVSKRPSLLWLMTAQKESEMELGNRASEQSWVWDFPNKFLEGFKSAASAVRRQTEILGRPLTGFVNVGANLLNRSFYFTPLGLLRVANKKLVNKEEAKRIYSETMATDAQVRMRMYEGIAGTVALLVLELFRWRPEDKEWGIQITGNGPSTPGLKEAWADDGNQKGHIQFMDPEGNVRFAISYTRGGFDHLAIPLTFAGAHSDMDLEGKRASAKNTDWAFAYAQTAGRNVIAQAQFFGAKALFNAYPTSTKPNAIAGWAGYNLQPFTPWGGMTRSITKMLTGPQDESSWRSAVASNLVVVQWTGLHKPGPAINSLGDQIGNHPGKGWQMAAQRGETAGVPFFLALDPTAENDQVYGFLMRRGVSPSMPMRSTLEAKNGFIEDPQWTEYVKTRGAILKSSILRRMSAMERMDGVDAQAEMEKLSTAATREAKRKLGLE